jgi:methylase of polypeptide subunit release factors
MNPLKISHILWKEHLNSIGKEELCIVDATCGNGHDSLFLASFKGMLHCIDIQEKAIEQTKTRLVGQQNVKFHHRSHQDLSFIEGEIDLIVYNLGYLPGTNKKVITQADTTAESLKSALSKLSKGGMISIMMYTGHPGGLSEKNSIIDLIKTLPPKYSINHITNPLKPTCPEILIIT